MGRAIVIAHQCRPADERLGPGRLASAAREASRAARDRGGCEDNWRGV